MAKLGSMEYPELSFSTALDVIQTVKREKITTVDALAKRLGHTGASSGTFFIKMASLNKFYGLVSQNKAVIDLTERAHRILVGMSEEEKAAARREAVENVALFRALHSKLGADYNKADFAPHLRDLTGAPVNEVQEVASRIQKLYDDAVTYIGSRFAESRPPATGEATVSAFEIPVNPSSEVLILVVPNKPRITVPYEPLFIESVREYLQKLSQELERERNRDKVTEGTGSETRKA